MLINFLVEGEIKSKTESCTDNLQHPSICQVISRLECKIDFIFDSFIP